MRNLNGTPPSETDDMPKILKRKVEVKETSFSTGTSSELEPKKRDISQF